MRPAASIAHEGNPRFDSLDVVGTLDGDIFLIPNQLPVDAVSGTSPEDIIRPFPPPVNTELCSDVLMQIETGVVSSDSESSILKTYSVASIAETLVPSLIQTTPLAVTHVPGEEAFDITAIDYTLVTGQCLCGYEITIMVHNAGGSPPQGRETEIGLRYVGPIGGSTPMTGLCFAVDPASTVSNFTGWVLLVNEVSQLTQLMYYKNESLGGLPDPTHIVATAPIPPAGKMVEIFYSRDTARIEVYTEDPAVPSNFEIIITYTSATQIANGTRCNAGLVWIGQATGTEIQEAGWDIGNGPFGTFAYMRAN